MIKEKEFLRVGGGGVDLPNQEFNNSNIIIYQKKYLVQFEQVIRRLQLIQLIGTFGPM